MNIFADIGNTAIKWCEVEKLPRPAERSADEPRCELAGAFTRIERAHHREPILVSPAASRCWWISSVHQPAADWLEHWIRSTLPEDRIEWISRKRMPIKVDLEEPETVGLDRLLGAVAVNARRDPSAHAIYCDFGTATTINVVSDAGVFLGGAILPGIQTQLQALSQATDRLPNIDWKQTPPPDALIGKKTRSAILSGVVHGHAFGVTEMIRRFAQQLGGTLELWLTGGGLPNVEMAWPIEPRFVPHLVLEGMCHYALAVGAIDETE